MKRDFTAGDLYGAIHTFKRLRTIMKTLVQQLDILETMTPMSFSAFRDRLDTASGFQSYQFRELEFVMGLKRPEMLKHAAGDVAQAAPRETAARAVGDRTTSTISSPIRGGDSRRAAQEARRLAPTGPTRRSRRALLRLYTTRPELAILFESMTDLDEGFQEWKYRHVKLVERTIGNKKGTGGSLGVEFLKQSLFQPLFPDLWAIRHEL